MLIVHCQRQLPLSRDFHRLALFFFFNDTATTEIYTLSLHDALPISRERERSALGQVARRERRFPREPADLRLVHEEVARIEPAERPTGIGPIPPGLDPPSLELVDALLRPRAPFDARPALERGQGAGL